MKVIPIVLEKPKYTDMACNNCGLCCITTICPIGQIVYPETKHGEVCPGLIEAEKGKRLCKLVIAEHAKIKDPKDRDISNSLGIGFFCSMPDPRTTPDEVRYSNYRHKTMAQERSGGKPMVSTPIFVEAN